MKKNLLKASLTALLAASVLAACSPQGESTQSNQTVHTEDPVSEAQYGALLTGEVTNGQKVFVATQGLRVRSTPKVEDGNVVAQLNVNDKLEVVDSQAIGVEQFIAVRVIDSASGAPRSQTVYASKKYLNDKAVAVFGGLDPSKSKNFVITNVATETIRVYRRCEPSEGCVNKMIYEVRGTNGEQGKKGEFRTDLGYFNITEWIKFYGVPGQYAPWYREGYPELPPPGNRDAWLSKKVMPPGFSVKARGPFGWYTAKVGPNPNGQWFHGTLGWGADKRKFVDFKSSTLAGIARIFGIMTRSHGCTSMDNESIAFMRMNLPVGATYIKIYAKEATRYSVPQGYDENDKTGRLDYILTKNGAGKNQHELPAREVVLANGTPRDQWLEEGTSIYDKYPTPVRYKGGGSKGGDLYKVGEENMKGVFLVDEGVLVGYEHPTVKVKVGGYKDDRGRGKLPSFVISTDTNYVMPVKNSDRDNDNDD